MPLVARVPLLLVAMLTAAVLALATHEAGHAAAAPAYRALAAAADADASAGFLRDELRHLADRRGYPVAPSAIR